MPIQFSQKSFPSQSLHSKPHWKLVISSYMDGLWNFYLHFQASSNSALLLRVNPIYLVWRFLLPRASSLSMHRSLARQTRSSKKMLYKTMPETTYKFSIFSEFKQLKRRAAMKWPGHRNPFVKMTGKPQEFHSICIFRSITSVGTFFC